MTKKEIENFLANTKVYVAGKSNEIQEKLFSFGYRWCDGCTEVKYTENQFLYIDNNHCISYGNDMCFFSACRCHEITPDEILSLKLTVSGFRPFKTQEECWQEMLKHEPFGWIKDKVEYDLISSLSDVIIWLDNKSLFTFKEAFNNYTFADGTPFGIKED